MPERLYPMKMQPAFKDYIWGGTRLRGHYNKLSALPKIAESWEVSTHPDGLSIIDNGRLKGQTLASAVGGLPIIIKLIDAKEPLSFQVHPGDEYALRKENQPGKNEMWYVLEAEPGAELILGFNEPAGKEELRHLIGTGGITQAVRRVPVKAGDCYCVSAGMLHAIGGGIVIAEVQQSSNVTYRVYDYGRAGPDGKGRELHIEKALDVLDTSLIAQKADSGILAGWEYFHCELITVEKEKTLCCGGSAFMAITVIDGTVMPENDDAGITLRKGESAFIPSSAGNCIIKGTGKALLVKN